jgi:hypothetical protein
MRRTRIFRRRVTKKRTTAIGFDLFPGQHQIRSRERLPKQAISPQASSFVSRRPCFITPPFGFTDTFAASCPLALRYRLLSGSCLSARSLCSTLPLHDQSPSKRGIELADVTRRQAASHPAPARH